MTQKEFSNIGPGLRAKLLPLARKFCRRCNASVDAEDVVQETMVTLWQLYKQDYPISNPEPLAFKILKTKCIAEYRKKNLDMLPIEGIEQEGGLSASCLLDQEDAIALKHTLFSHLTKTQQDLIKMRGLQGLSLDEIAEVTGKPKTSVKSTISAARKKMIDLIEKTI